MSPLGAETSVKVDFRLISATHRDLRSEINASTFRLDLFYRLAVVVLRIPPEGWDVPKDSFFQNNFLLLPRLVETVRDRLREAGSRYLVDAYCGVGFFALELADLVTRFTGVELDALAVRAARTNARKRGRENGEFVQARTEDALPGLVKQFPSADLTVILDPPRTGCTPGIIQCLREIRPRQVLYVSCHPATLARDLNAFCEAGVFHLNRVTPLDMFPQTQHVEAVADIRSTVEAVGGA